MAVCPNPNRYEERKEKHFRASIAKTITPPSPVTSTETRMGSTDWEQLNISEERVLYSGNLHIYPCPSLGLSSNNP